MLSLFMYNLLTNTKFKHYPQVNGRRRFRLRDPDCPGLHPVHRSGRPGRSHTGLHLGRLLGALQRPGRMGHPAHPTSRHRWNVLW